jgi:hypothetical protein
MLYLNFMYLNKQLKGINILSLKREPQLCIVLTRNIFEVLLNFIYITGTRNNDEKNFRAALYTIKDFENTAKNMTALGKYFIKYPNSKYLRTAFAVGETQSHVDTSLAINAKIKGIYKIEDEKYPATTIDLAKLCDKFDRNWQLDDLDGTWEYYYELLFRHWSGYIHPSVKVLLGYEENKPQNLNELVLFTSIDFYLKSLKILQIEEIFNNNINLDEFFDKLQTIQRD